jgi:trk system potassium uptake protein TrkA
MTRLLTIQDKDFEIVGIKIPADSKSVGKTIKDLILPAETNLLLIITRDHKPLIITPEVKIQTGDEIIATTSLENEEQLKTAFIGK